MIKPFHWWVCTQEERKQGLSSCLYTHVHSHSFHNSKRGKRCKCLSTHAHITTMWSTHIVEYHQH